MAKGQPGIPQHAEVFEMGLQLAKQLDEKRGTHLIDPEVGDIAAQVPQFSAGTVAIDEQSGKPILPENIAPPVAEAEAPAPEATPKPPPEVPPAPEEQPPPPSPPRDDQGRFTAGEAAAEAAAAADPWQDYEEITYDDADTGKSYTVRARKEDAQQVRGGYQRRTDYTRKTMALADSRRTLQPLIESGQLGNVLPLIERAMQDPEYGQFVWEAHQRRVAGLPLTIQQQQAAQVATQILQPTPPSEPAPTYNLDDDPYMKQHLTPLQREIESNRQAVQQLQQQIAMQQQAQREAEMRQAEGIRVIQETNAELARRYPDTWTGDPARDNDLMMRLTTNARESGYIQRYGLSVPVLVMTYEGIMHQPRAEAAASPAVASIAAAQRARDEKRVAAAAAAAVPSGAPATNTTAPLKPPPVPETRNADGSMKNLKQYGREMAHYLSQRQQQSG